MTTGKKPGPSRELGFSGNRLPSTPPFMEFFGFDDVEIVLPDPCWGDFDDDGDVDGADLADFLAGDSWTPQLLETLAGEFGRDDCPLPVTPQ